MAEACRKRDLNEIARLLKMDDDKKREEQVRLRNAYANPNGMLLNVCGCTFAKCMVE